MRVLLDTNILIHREDAKPVSEELGELLRLMSESGAMPMVHPLSVIELQKDANESRRMLTLSKIAAYAQLQESPDQSVDREFLKFVHGDSAPFLVAVDDALLYAVYRDAVDFLVTEDRGILRKSNRVRLHDRVLAVSDALHLFRTLVLKEKPVSPPALREEFIYNLHLEDPIFDSLKREYMGFDDWFREKAREGRKAWVHHYRPDGTLGAVLICKEEDEAVASSPALPKKRRLKVSTLKVADVGNRVGEFFIRLAVELSVKRRLYEVYLTHFTQPDDRLVDLIAEYGFKKVAVMPSGEDVFLKGLRPTISELRHVRPLEISGTFYPSFYDGVLSRKFIVPIRPEYHHRLFTDFPGRQMLLSEQAGEFVIEGNTIKKAYVCHSPIRRIRSGNIVLFYMSGRGILTSLGVVEDVYSGQQSASDIFRLVGKRTVYSQREIERMSQRPTTLILFRHHFHLGHPFSLGRLKRNGVLKGPPQSITEITESSYRIVRAEGGLDERFAFDQAKAC